MPTKSGWQLLKVSPNRSALASRSSQTRFMPVLAQGRIQVRESQRKDRIRRRATIGANEEDPAGHEESSSRRRSRLFDAFVGCPLPVEFGQALR